MKKLKSILWLILCCSLACIFIVGCSSRSGCNDDETSSSGSTSESTADSSTATSSSTPSSVEEETRDYDTVLDSISVNTSAAKTSFAIGEAFSYDGLIVTATTSVNLVESTSTVESGYVVDSSEFDNEKVGTYTIYVSYALSAAPSSVRYNTYTVTVSSTISEYANIELEYSGTTTYDWVDGGVTIDLTDNNTVTVTQYVGDDPAKLTETELSSSDYTLYYYVNGGTKTEVTGTTITATEQGIYAVWAEATYSVDNYLMSDFVIITVGEVDDGSTVEGISYSDIASDASYSSNEEITSNSLFTLTSVVSTKYGAASAVDDFTDLEGYTVSPTCGLKNSSPVDKSATCDTYKIVANADCKIEVYLSVANDSFNSNRDATINYSLNGTTTTAATVSKRATVVTIQLDLNSGDELVIGLTNGTTNTAKLYLWGALADVPSAE